jgi:hypothetical protein
LIGRLLWDTFEIPVAFVFRREMRSTARIIRPSTARTAIPGWTLATAPPSAAVPWASISSRRAIRPWPRRSRGARARLSRRPGGARWRCPRKFGAAGVDPGGSVGRLLADAREPRVPALSRRPPSTRRERVRPSGSRIPPRARAPPTGDRCRAPRGGSDRRAPASGGCPRRRSRGRARSGLNGFGWRIRSSDERRDGAR